MLRDEDLLLRLLGRCHSRSINVTWSNFPWAPMFPVGSCSMAVRKRRRLPGNAPSDGLENCWAGAARTRALQAPTPSRLGRDEDNGCVKGTAISRALPTRRIRLAPRPILGQPGCIQHTTSSDQRARHVFRLQTRLLPVIHDLPVLASPCNVRSWPLGEPCPSDPWDGDPLASGGGAGNGEPTLPPRILCSSNNSTALGASGDLICQSRLDIG